MHDTISLGHGSGGKLTNRLIKDLFLTYFTDKKLKELTDATPLQSAEIIAFTTDSYVVDPVFFPGGDIGKLAVCGTVNDLAVSGALPKYISAAFIIEEGFSMSNLETIVKSMASEATFAGISIVTGDTKIVNKGKCDKIFINTSGIGLLSRKNVSIGSGNKIKNGDQIIVNGNMGDHGIAVLSSRESLSFISNVKSDCACLNHLIAEALSICDIKFMRDITRGGLATVLCELAEKINKGIEIKEEDIPVDEDVIAACEIFGYDPLFLPNEGKIIMIVEKADVGKLLETLRKNPLGKNSAVIGEIVDEHTGMALMHTDIGGCRILDMLSGEQLPRIC